MDGQRALFMETEHGPARVEPRGFRYEEQIVSEEEETFLAAELEQLDLKPFEFHGYLGNRRVVNFGLKYDFSRRSVQRVGDMPPFLNDLLSRAARFARCEKDAFRQVGVNALSERAQRKLDKNLAHLEVPLHLRSLWGGSVGVGTQYSTARRIALFDRLPHPRGYLSCATLTVCRI